MLLIGPLAPFEKLDLACMLYTRILTTESFQLVVNTFQDKEERENLIHRLGIKPSGSELELVTDCRILPSHVTIPSTPSSPNKKVTPVGMKKRSPTNNIDTPSASSKNATNGGSYSSSSDPSSVVAPTSPGSQVSNTSPSANLRKRTGSNAGAQTPTTKTATTSEADVDTQTLSEALLNRPGPLTVQTPQPRTHLAPIASHSAKGSGIVSKQFDVSSLSSSKCNSPDNKNTMRSVDSMYTEVSVMRPDIDSV
jgi:hypothetical protein